MIRRRRRLNFSRKALYSGYCRNFVARSHPLISIFRTFFHFVAAARFSLRSPIPTGSSP